MVCHDATLDDDFFTSMKSNVGGFGSNDLRDYTKLYNPFQTTRQKPNPHKSYGYLIQPKLSQKVREFFDSMDGVGRLRRDAYMDVGN